MKRLTLTISDDVHAEVQRRAGRVGLSASAWVRLVAITYTLYPERSLETMEEIWADMEAQNRYGARTFGQADAV